MKHSQEYGLEITSAGARGPPARSLSCSHSTSSFRPTVAYTTCTKTSAGVAAARRAAAAGSTAGLGRRNVSASGRPVRRRGCSAILPFNALSCRDSPCKRERIGGMTGGPRRGRPASLICLATPECETSAPCTLVSTSPTCGSRGASHAGPTILRRLKDTHGHSLSLTAHLHRRALNDTRGHSSVTAHAPTEAGTG